MISEFFKYSNIALKVWITVCKLVKTHGVSNLATKKEVLQVEDKRLT